jgi:hypothetical protein
MTSPDPTALRRRADDLEARAALSLLRRGHVTDAAMTWLASAQQLRDRADALDLAAEPTDRAGRPIYLHAENLDN